jgi:hypothetical protein
VERFDVFSLPDHIEFLFGDIHAGQHILPLVLFANEEFVIGRECKPAALPNETNKRHIAQTAKEARYVRI